MTWCGCVSPWDPPYNNGETYQHYFDNMGHEQWLTSVTDRLRKVKPLLADTGSIWISIDDSELHYLKVAADEIFGRANFIGTIVWERRTTRENRRVLSMNHEYSSCLREADLPARRMESIPKCTSTNRNSNSTIPKPGCGSARSFGNQYLANVQDGHATPQQFYDLLSPGGDRTCAAQGKMLIKVYVKTKDAS